MQFFCPVICGLLLSCVCFRGSCEDVFVDQSPSRITVKDGESAQISCCWNNTQTLRLKVAWLKNQERIQEVEGRNQIIRHKNCSYLHIINIVHSDTGDYVCKVTQDIPVLRDFEGEKTVLKVTEVEPCITQTTTQGFISSSVSRKPDVSMKDQKILHHGQRNGSWRDVIIFIFRSLPFICLLLAFIYLNRDEKPLRRSKPDGRAGYSEAADEDLEAGEKQRNKTEEEDESICELEEERDKPEKPDAAPSTEEEKETLLVDIERGTDPVNENTEKNTHLMDDEDDQSVSVLQLCDTQEVML